MVATGTAGDGQRSRLEPTEEVSPRLLDLAREVDNAVQEASEFVHREDIIAQVTALFTDFADSSKQEVVSESCNETCGFHNPDYNDIVKKKRSR